VLKSAVQSANTAIFIPSSFDFIRVHNYFRKNPSVTFTVLSEYGVVDLFPRLFSNVSYRYSSNQDISRARQAFFQGKKSFILISERFHFYRRSADLPIPIAIRLFIGFFRYKIRGIRNLIFYAPPDHPQFFTELLSYPFLDEGVEASDITCLVLHSKYDWFRLERIAGTDGAVELIRTS
jgi:U3 small nucleolar RNA-associated protein 25